jgi:hypothetical protein
MLERFTGKAWRRMQRKNRELTGKFRRQAAKIYRSMTLKISLVIRTFSSALIGPP